MMIVCRFIECLYFSNVSTPKVPIPRKSQQIFACSSGGGNLYKDAGLSQDAMMDLLIQKLIQSKIESRMSNPQGVRRKKKKGSSADNMMKMMTMMMLMQGGSMDMGALKGLLGGSKSLPATAAAGPEDSIFDGPAPGQGDDLDVAATGPPQGETTRYKPHPTFTDKYGKKLPKPAWHP
uniref:Signal recognition particle SRP54 subunit M-domain domain-containing protein n=1 Tax=Romanomermis culicivorax TaxID=13658 RepID=A0A915HEV2_ROMCU